MQPEEISSQPGIFDHLWWFLHSNATFLALLVLILACIGSILLYRPFFRRDRGSPETSMPVSGSSLSFQPSGDGSSFYFAWPREGKPSDIYQWTLSSQPVNLTNTPGYSEWWPVPSPADDQLAFFAVSSAGERSLRVMDANGAVIDVTYNSGDSGLGTLYQIDLTTPPRWSEDGAWIAFLGVDVEGEGTKTEVFVVDVARSTVYRLTHGGGTIIELRWVDSDQIIYARQEGEQSVAFYQIAVSTEPTIPVLLSVVEAEP